MNVKRFTGRTSREAMQKVKAAFGDDAVVLSTKPATEGGIEILAMAGDSVPAMDNYPAEPDKITKRIEPMALPAATTSAPAQKQSAMQSVAHLAATVQDDVRQLAMSTLSFQDYVRERMLKRRQAAMQNRTEPALSTTPEQQLNQRFAANKPTGPAVSTQVELGAHSGAQSAPQTPTPVQTAAPVALPTQAQLAQMRQAATTKPAQVVPLRSDNSDLTMSTVSPTRPALRSATSDASTLNALRTAQEANDTMLTELRAMRTMMKERFETMAFLDQLGRTPCQASLAQKLLDGGFSSVLIRKMLDAMPAEVRNGHIDEIEWANQVLQRNLYTADNEPAIEDRSGVFALIGSTGVGKTTTTAKLAALFAAKHGASNLGLITLDAYRVGAHEQLRTYGRILGVPVHMAHDRAALEDLLDLLGSKKLILVDTAGMAQRDSRAKEMLDMLAHKRISKLMVINAASQGDAIEDVMVSYQASACAGIVLSKLDEAVKLGPALDALIRHKLKVLGVANGQRVPEDWHRLSSQALVHRALRASLNPAYRLDPGEVSLVFSAAPAPDAPSTQRPV